MIKRYDSKLEMCGGEYFAGLEAAEDGEWVEYEDHEAAMQANVDTRAANLASVEARALRMEQTIARVREVLREMDENAKYVGDPSYEAAADALRAALEAT